MIEKHITLHIVQKAKHKTMLKGTLVTLSQAKEKIYYILLATKLGNVNAKMLATAALVNFLHFLLHLQFLQVHLSLPSLQQAPSLQQSLQESQQVLGSVTFLAH